MVSLGSHSAQPGRLHSIFRIAEAAHAARTLLEEDVGVTPEPHEVLADRFALGPLRAYHSRLNEHLRLSGLPELAVERCATLGDIEERILSGGSLQYTSGWIISAAGAAHATLPGGCVSYVAARSPRAINEGTRLSLAGLLMMLLIVIVLANTSSADVGAAPRPPRIEVRRAARASRHALRKHVPIEDMVESQPFRLDRSGLRRAYGAPGAPVHDGRARRSKQEAMECGTTRLPTGLRAHSSPAPSRSSPRQPIPTCDLVPIPIPVRRLVRSPSRPPSRLCILNHRVM